MTSRAERMRAWRATRGGQAYIMASKRREKARRAACTILIERHPDEYAELYSRELRRIEDEFRQEVEDLRSFDT